MEKSIEPKTYISTLLLMDELLKEVDNNTLAYDPELIELITVSDIVEQ